MGVKCTIDPFRNAEGRPIGDCEEEVYKQVHAVGTVGGDAGTLCGMPFVDEGDAQYTNKAVNCPNCISELESQEKYVKRNGKWY